MADDLLQLFSLDFSVIEDSTVPLLPNVPSCVYDFLSALLSRWIMLSQCAIPPSFETLISIPGQWLQRSLDPFFEPPPDMLQI
jgi:hypothetical protein